MNDFRFRLQNIVRLRERVRDQAAAAYREALAAQEKLQQQVDRLLREHADQQPLQSQLILGRVDTQRLIESQRFQLHLLQQVQHLKSQMKLIAEECEKRRLKLVHREQELGALDKLRSRQKDQWLVQQAQREQIAVDQWAAFKYWKSQESSASERG